MILYTHYRSQTSIHKNIIRYALSYRMHTLLDVHLTFPNCFMDLMHALVGVKDASNGRVLNDRQLHDTWQKALPAAQPAHPWIRIHVSA